MNNTNSAGDIQYDILHFLQIIKDYIFFFYVRNIVVRLGRLSVQIR